MTGREFISRAPIGFLYSMEGDRDTETSLLDSSFTAIRVKLHDGMGDSEAGDRQPRDRCPQELCTVCG
jgi:hypothetical protein